MLWLAALDSRSQPLAPVLNGNVVYVAAGQNVYALNATDGAEIWHYPLGDKATTAPIVVDGNLYIGGNDGYLYAVAGYEPAPASS